ncbi:MAG: hypothetical protein LBT11_03785 [Treponema sp.]|jgi:hypothetical protein|nr:hypothetical protein [Treponema sp.]
MKRPVLILSLLLTVPGLAAQAVSAQAVSAQAVAQAASAQAAFPSLEPGAAARELNLRVRDGIRSWEDLADAALWASDAGVSRTGRSYREILAAGVAELRAAPNLPAGERERGEYVLKFIYDKYLAGYSANQTRLDQLIDTGQYNCVSSAVFYAIFAQALDLNVAGVITRDHAFVTLRVGDELIDIETTNPYGFDPGSRREFHDDFGKLTGFAYVPARNYRDRAAISPLELVSLILSNRIALEARNRYAEAVPLAINRAALLAGRSSQADSPLFDDPETLLLDCIFNYGASLLRAGREAEALAWADTARQRYGDLSGGESRWQEFYYTALNNYLAGLVRAGRYGELRGILVSYTPRLNPGDLGRLNSLVTEAELTAGLQAMRNSDDAERLLVAIDQAAAGGLLPGSRARELRNYLILQNAGWIASGEGQTGAVSYLEAMIARYGSNSDLDNAIRVYQQNAVIALHNQFAELYNRRDYGAARSFILEALAVFPGNRQLTQDLNTVEQALRR